MTCDMPQADFFSLITVGGFAMTNEILRDCLVLVTCDMPQSDFSLITVGGSAMTSEILRD